MGRAGGVCEDDSAWTGLVGLGWRWWEVVSAGLPAASVSYRFGAALVVVGSVSDTPERQPAGASSWHFRLTFGCSTPPALTRGL